MRVTPRDQVSRCLDVARNLLGWNMIAKTLSQFTPTRSFGSRCIFQGANLTKRQPLPKECNRSSLSTTTVAQPMAGYVPLHQEEQEEAHLCPTLLESTVHDGLVYRLIQESLHVVLKE